MKWDAMIVTESNRLQTVSFDCPSPVRADAIAMCQSMYGAKVVKYCNPSPDNYKKPAQSSSSSSSSSGTDSTGFIYLALFIGGLYVIVTFWPILLAIGALFGIYKLVTYLDS